jgi:hypothetical protein
MVLDCNPGTAESEGGRSVLRDHPELHNKTCEKLICVIHQMFPATFYAYLLINLDKLTNLSLH